MMKTTTMVVARSYDTFRAGADSLEHYYRERLFPVYDGERYGYINDRGEMAVPFRY